MTTELPLFSDHSLSSCRLRPTSRCSKTLLSVWGPDISWGFPPLSAFIEVTCEQVSTLTAPRSQVFATSQQVFYASADLRAYSIPLALAGLSLQSLPVQRSPTVFRLNCSFTVARLSRFPFLRHLCSTAHCHWGFPYQQLDFCGPLAFLIKAGFRHRLGPILKL